MDAARTEGGDVPHGARQLTAWAPFWAGPTEPIVEGSEGQAAAQESVDVHLRQCLPFSANRASDCLTINHFFGWVSRKWRIRGRGMHMLMTKRSPG